MFLPAHFGEQGKITWLTKKQKQVQQLGIYLFHTLWISDCSSAFQEQYENTIATSVQSWRVTVSMTHSNMLPRESQSIITSSFLPDKIANCLWSCSIISTATSGRISCCMISSVQAKTEIFSEFIQLQWQFFSSFNNPEKQRWHSKKKNLARLLPELLYDCHDKDYDTYRVSSSAC